MSKPREFWIMSYKKTQSIISCNKKPSQLIFDPATDEEIHVREVVPIDWEKVWEDLGKYMMDDSDKTYYFDKIQQLVEKQLAGEE